MLRAKLIYFLCAIILLASCSSKPSQFYILSPAPQAADSYATTQQGIILGIEPIELADYLNQPQIVTRLSNNELYQDEYHRWSEPLKENIERVLAQNLRTFVPKAQLVDYPWRKSANVDIKIQVEISRFDVDSQGESILIAHWELIDNHTNKLIINQQKRYTLPATPTDYTTISRSMNANLTTLSHDIARDIHRYGMASIAK